MNETPNEKVIAVPYGLRNTGECLCTLHVAASAHAISDFKEIRMRIEVGSECHEAMLRLVIWMFSWS